MSTTRLTYSHRNATLSYCNIPYSNFLPHSHSSCAGVETNFSRSPQVPLSDSLSALGDHVDSLRNNDPTCSHEPILDSVSSRLSDILGSIVTQFTSISRLPVKTRLLLPHPVLLRRELVSSVWDCYDSKVIPLEFHSMNSKDMTEDSQLDIDTSQQKLTSFFVPKPSSKESKVVPNLSQPTVSRQNSAGFELMEGNDISIKPSPTNTKLSGLTGFSKRKSPTSSFSKIPLELLPVNNDTYGYSMLEQDDFLSNSINTESNALEVQRSRSRSNSSHNLRAFNREKKHFSVASMAYGPFSHATKTNLIDSFSDGKPSTLVLSPEDATLFFPESLLCVVDDNLHEFLVHPTKQAIINSFQQSSSPNSKPRSSVQCSEIASLQPLGLFLHALPGGFSKNYESFQKNQLVCTMNMSEICSKDCSTSSISTASFASKVFAAPKVWEVVVNRQTYVVDVTKLVPIWLLCLGFISPKTCERLMMMTTISKEVIHSIPENNITGSMNEDCIPVALSSHTSSQFTSLRAAVSHFNRWVSTYIMALVDTVSVGIVGWKCSQLLTFAFCLSSECSAIRDSPTSMYYCINTSSILQDCAEVNGGDIMDNYFRSSLEEILFLKNEREECRSSSLSSNSISTSGFGSSLSSIPPSTNILFQSFQSPFLQKSPEIPSRNVPEPKPKSLLEWLSKGNQNNLMKKMTVSSCHPVKTPSETRNLWELSLPKELFNLVQPSCMKKRSSFASKGVVPQGFLSDSDSDDENTDEVCSVDGCTCIEMRTPSSLLLSPSYGTVQNSEITVLQSEKYQYQRDILLGNQHGELGYSDISPKNLQTKMASTSASSLNSSQSNMLSLPSSKTRSLGLGSLGMSSIPIRFRLVDVDKLPGRSQISIRDLLRSMSEVKLQS